MGTMRILGLAVAVTAAVLLPSASPASAQPVAGATYNGDITGCAEPPCGTVQFQVSGDASQVQMFTASDVPGDTCLFSGPQTYPLSLDIVDDSFGPGIPGLYEVSGFFPSEGSAQGTLRLVNTDPVCDTGTLDWTAAVGTPTPTPTPTPTFTPGPPVGGIAEYPDVARSSVDRAASIDDGSDSLVRSYGALAGGLAAAALSSSACAWYVRRRRIR